MADSTLTSGPAYSPSVVPRYIHAGVECIPFSWDAGGQTISLSQVIQLAKIPKNAVIVDIKCNGWIGCDGNATIDFGLNSDVSAFGSGKAISATATTAITMAAGSMPYKCSISDDAGVDFRYFQAKTVTVASHTATAILKGSIWYTNDTGIKD